MSVKIKKSSFNAAQFQLATEMLNTSRLNARYKKLQRNLIIVPVAANGLAIAADRVQSALFDNASNSFSGKDLFILAAGVVCSSAINTLAVHRAVKPLRPANEIINAENSENKKTVALFIGMISKSATGIGLVNGISTSISISCISIGQKLYEYGIGNLHMDRPLAGGIFGFFAVAAAARQIGYDLVWRSQFRDSASWISSASGTFDGSTSERLDLLTQVSDMVKRMSAQRHPEPK